MLIWKCRIFHFTLNRYVLLVTNLLDMKKLLLILTSVLNLTYAQSLKSQSNYLDGSIIDLEGDTIKGLINYLNWDKNPDFIEFMKIGDSHARILTPLLIKEFHVADEIYESATIEVDESSYKIEDLDYDPKLKLKERTVFLQVIFRGSKSLCYYKDDDSKEHFFIGAGLGYELLVYKTYLKKVDNYTNVIENKKYAGQLVLYLDNCPALKNEIARCEYDKKNLSALFDKYYECIEEKESHKKQKDKVKVNAGVFVGMSYATISCGANDLYASNYTKFLRAEYDWSLNLSGGISIDFILPRNLGRWSINNEFIYTSYNITGKYEYYFYNENEYKYNIIELGYSYIKMNNMVRFRIPIEAQFLYINLGISNGFAFSETNYEQTVTKWSSEILEIEEGLALANTRKYEQGLLFGLGGKYKNFSIEFRFELSNGMSDYEALSTSVRRFYSFLGYTF